MMEADPTNSLYIFFHVPKCAGTTFTTHLGHDFKKDNRVSICYGNGIPNLQIGADDEVEPYLKNLTREKKNEILAIYGHHVFNRIHKFFDERQCRYITFLRDPIERVVSHYNFMIGQSKNEGRKVRMPRAAVLQDGSLLPIEDWIEREATMQNLVVRHINRYFLEKNENDSIFNCPDRLLLDAKEALESFYFVGLVKRFRRDAAFLYHQLGVKKYFPNQNVSKKYLSLSQLSPSAKKQIMGHCQLDMALYEHAIKLNQFQRKRYKEYRIVCPRKLISSHRVRQE